jgi:hypothetical protein
MRDVTLHTCATAAPAVRRDGYTQEYIRDSEGITYGKDTKSARLYGGVSWAEMAVMEKQGTWNSVLPFRRKAYTYGNVRGLRYSKGR